MNLRRKLGEQMSKSLGIIGGMGPKATSVFFDKVIESTDAHKDQDHINMVILNHATLPDRTETILSGDDGAFLDEIRKDIEILEKAGVSNIAIPCNTSHYFYEKIQEMTDIHVIHMIEETIKEISEKYGRTAKIGIMATNGTIKSDIYKKVANSFGLEVYYPDPDTQAQIMDIIYNKVKSDLTLDVTEIENIVFDFIFNHECSCVILACTELSCIQLNKDVEKYCVDAMEVLVKRSIELSGKYVKGQHFDEFLTESFANDTYERELRLSSQECEAVKKRFPHATITSLDQEIDTDGKAWYKVNLISDDKPFSDHSGVQETLENKQRIKV
ncbi:amino acid racemase [Niallia sp. XMNu-256]|uniref:aspartate/glutamate racemase family protein n=1 Tax=Niallia sp. XMNu-256 TaxID=3082444 RepID=UPI0030D570EB